MAYYIRNGNTFQVTDEAAVDIQRSLPAGNYTVKEHPMTGALYLEMIDPFQPLKKLYGKVPSYADRIINTFRDRPNSTGAMFTGEKGSGKSLLAKEICIAAANLNIPTLVINQSWHGDKFNKLIQDIDQEAVILFDEFEKVYHDSTKQEAILTLLDGVYPTKKLFVMTCNDKWRIDQHMRNRPGRLFYMIDFKGLDSEFIIEYCEDNLNNKDHISKLVTLASLFAEFNFDMLKAVVEDMNRYDETPQEALAILNAKPEYEKNSGVKYDVTLVTPCGAVVPSEFLEPGVYNNNPLSVRAITVYTLLGDNDVDVVSELSSESCSTSRKSPTEEQREALRLLLRRYTNIDDDFVFNQDELTKVDGESGTFEYLCNESGIKLRLVRQKMQSYNYFNLL